MGNGIVYRFVQVVLYAGLPTCLVVVLILWIAS